MQKIFSYVFFLLGTIVMVLSILAIFGLIVLTQDPGGSNTWLYIGMLGFGLIICLVGYFMLSAGGGNNSDQLG
ncbi:MAG: hypothetical protein ACR2M0_00825 [Chloroflexia bacterium]